MIPPTRSLMRYCQAQLLFRKGHRLKVFVPRDEVHDKAVRAAMVRHGWRLAQVSPLNGNEAGPPSGERQP